MGRTSAGAAVALVAGMLVWGSLPIVDRSPAGEGERAPEGATLSSPLIAYARDEARAIDAMVVHSGTGPSVEWGAAAVPMNLSSIRKAVLALLFGIAEEKGLLDLDRTLGEVGIEESATPLTDAEKAATIRDLLMARSGVYLPAGAETALTTRTRPARGSAAPGERFFYNNWDFNVLGVVFERETEIEIGEALAHWLAAPLGLRDFHPSHVVWDRWGSSSDHATYRIHMSARDLARIGRLVLDEGRWGDTQIVSVAFVEDALTPWSAVGPPLSAPPFDGFGYAWWVEADRPNGLVLASGWGGQYLVIDRANELVVVARNDTGNSLLAQLWFAEFGTRGRVEDALRLRDIALTHLRGIRIPRRVPVRRRPLHDEQRDLCADNHVE